MAFNLKKQAQVKNYNKMLEDQTSELSLDANTNPTNYNGLLESDRVGDSVDKTSTYENHLNEARAGDDDQVISEKAMDKAKGLISRHEDGQPLMDYHKKGEQEQRKAFNLSEYNKGKGNRTLDKNPGEQLIGNGNKPMTGNVQPSQLLSNYDTREEFEKAHKMASQKLAIADAILYSIYRTAADESRELNKAEQHNINVLSKEKALVLAELAPTLGYSRSDVVTANKWHTTTDNYTDEGNKVGHWPGGWLNGEWKCPDCKTMLGKNLRGQSPYALVRKHKEECTSGSEKVAQWQDPNRHLDENRKKQELDRARVGQLPDDEDIDSDFEENERVERAYSKKEPEDYDVI